MCDICGGNHFDGFCQMLSSSLNAEVNYIGNQGRPQFYNIHFPNSFNQGCKQNYSGASESGSQQQQHLPTHERSTKLKKLFNTLYNYLSRITKLQMYS